MLDNAEKLTKNQNSTLILKSALNLLFCNKKNWIRKIIFILIELILVIVVATDKDTISMTGEIFGITNGVILALFGVVFMGYAFFQALINENLLVYMLIDSGGEKSKLEESNNYFAQVMMLHLNCIITNIFIIIFMKVLPEQWVLCSNQYINERISGFGILVALYLNIETIWETKSFIYNVFQLFNAHAVSRVLKIIKKLKDEE